MTTGFRDTIGLHAEALVLRERRNGILASNIANAATPQFKARDFDFTAALQDATGDGTMRRADSRHLSESPGGGAGLGYRVPVNPALDGNTVELGVEQMEFAENTLRYQTSLQMLNRRISGLMTAIKGE
jgi:flagellar basal-body rod protein FlgB